MFSLQRILHLSTYLLMDQSEQTSIFSRELNKFINRFANEFRLTYASMIGVLVIKIVSMIVNHKEKK